MDYIEARNYVSGALKFGWRMGLERMVTLMALLGNPQDRLRCIHVAGTNGKGSTTTFAAYALACAGKKVGVYTSPYIERFTERIRIIDGLEGVIRLAEEESTGEIGDEDFAGIVTRVAASVMRLEQDGMEHPTEFELITAVAFLHFAQACCDIVVLETGLGGRLDSTNVISCPEACIITAMGYDHMDRLGASMAEIAGEKAGIIKPGCRTILYDPLTACDTPEDAADVEAVVRRRCEETGSPLTILRASGVETLAYGIDGQIFHIHDSGLDLTLQTSLLGAHQPMNATVAALAVHPLTGDKPLQQGISAARWLVRQEIVRFSDPTVMIDGSHNPQSVRELADTLSRLFPGRGIVFVCGVLADKAHDAMLRAVLTGTSFHPAAFFAVTPDSPRALSATALLEEARQVLAHEDLMKGAGNGYNRACKLCAVDDPCTAADEAIGFARETGAVVCIFGSLYMVGSVRTHLRLTGRQVPETERNV
ncbi:MAG TPA: folylpolyglutamate synthase/dihydrofolate synthase family protein [Clostridia bacterium]